MGAKYSIDDCIFPMWLIVLDDAKALKKVDAVSHGEGSQKVDDQNHRMEALCLSFLRKWSISKTDGRCHDFEEIECIKVFPRRLTGMPIITQLVPPSQWLQMLVSPPFFSFGDVVGEDISLGVL